MLRDVYKLGNLGFTWLSSDLAVQGDRAALRRGGSAETLRPVVYNGAISFPKVILFRGWGGAMDTTNGEEPVDRQVQVKFVTKLPRALCEATSAFAIPAKLGRYSLSEVVNTLLGFGRFERSDFNNIDCKSSKTTKRSYIVSPRRCS